MAKRGPRRFKKGLTTVLLNQLFCSGAVRNTWGSSSWTLDGSVSDVREDGGNGVYDPVIGDTGENWEKGSVSVVSNAVDGSVDDSVGAVTWINVGDNDMDGSIGVERDTGEFDGDVPVTGVSDTGENDGVGSIDSGAVRETGVNTRDFSDGKKSDTGENLGDDSVSDGSSHVEEVSETGENVGDGSESRAGSTRETDRRTGRLAS